MILVLVKKLIEVVRIRNWLLPVFVKMLCMLNFNRSGGLLWKLQAVAIKRTKTKNVSTFVSDLRGHLNDTKTHFLLTVSSYSLVVRRIIWMFKVSKSNLPPEYRKQKKLCKIYWKSMDDLNMVNKFPTWLEIATAYGIFVIFMGILRAIWYLAFIIYIGKFLLALLSLSHWVKRRNKCPILLV